MKTHPNCNATLRQCSLTRLGCSCLLNVKTREYGTKRASRAFRFLEGRGSRHECNAQQRQRATGHTAAGFSATNRLDIADKLCGVVCADDAHDALNLTRQQREAR